MSSNSFFEPFNITRWEHNTVNRLKDDLERQYRVSNDTADADAGRVLPSTPRKTTVAKSLWSFFARSRNVVNPIPVSDEEPDATVPTFEPKVMRRTYDLNSYGVNMLVDFGWAD